jgi:hypothetical protein
MCPLCIATGSLLLSGAGAGSAGALATLATRVLRGRRRRQERSDGAAVVAGSTGAGADLTHASTQPAPQ